MSSSKVKSGSPATVLEVTGFEAGGVGLCGFLLPFHACFVEERCFSQSELWCGAGVKHGMLKISPADLLRVTCGQRVDLAEGGNGEGARCEGVSTPNDAVCAKVPASSESLRSESTSSVAEEFKPDAAVETISTISAVEESQSVPWLAEQLAGVGDGSLRWFPERAFDFYPFRSETNGGESKTTSSRSPSSAAAAFTVVVEQDPGHVGGIVWDAETVLSHHLVERYGACSDKNAIEHGAESARTIDTIGSSKFEAPDKRRSMRGLKVVELGAGTGLAGCVCGLLGAKKVVLTELTEALPLLERNASRVLRKDCMTGNDSNIVDNDSIWKRMTTPVWSSNSAMQGHTRDAQYAVEALSWGEDLTKSSACAVAAPFDVILVADCVYLPELYSALANTIKQLAGPGTEVLICFEQRRRDISAFFDIFGDSEVTDVGEGELQPPNGAAGSEHLPGSDGRRPLGKPRCTETGPAVDSVPVKEVPSTMSKLEWEQTSLLASARALAKVHLARVVFE